MPHASGSSPATSRRCWSSSSRLQAVELGVGVEPAQDREAVLGERQRTRRRARRAAIRRSLMRRLPSVGLAARRPPSTFCVQPSPALTGSYVRGCVGVDARRDALDDEVGRAVEEAGDRAAAHRARRRRAAAGRRGAASRSSGRWSSGRACRRGCTRTIPRGTSTSCQRAVAEHLEAGHVVGEQDREHAVVGVRAHAHLARRPGRACRRARS